MADSLPDLDALRELGKSALAKAHQEAAADLAITADSANWMHARKRRSCFAAAAWVAGASHKQIADILHIRPQTAHRLVSSVLPGEVRRDIAAGRNIGRELLPFEIVEQFKLAFESHPSWLGILDTAKAFNAITLAEWDKL